MVRFYPLFIFILLASCNFEPRYEVPYTITPEQWKNGENEPSISSDEQCEIPLVDQWWDIFDDPLLDSLEKQAIKNNKNLQIAIERVFEERAMAGKKGADLYPVVNLDSFYYDLGFLSTAFGVPSTLAQNIPSTFRLHENLYDLSLNISYELDFWGKHRNTYKSALLSVEAKQRALQMTWLSLTTDLAINYFQLRALDSVLNILEKSISSRKEGVQVNENRYKGTLVPYTDVTHSEGLLYTAQADYYSLLRRRALKENQIAVLLGIPASEFRLEKSPLRSPPPLIPAGIPSDILLKRPDLQEAERIAASENASIGAAYASFFPSLDLTTNLGYFSPKAKDFLTWNSRLWTLGANAAETLFDAGRIQSDYDLAKIRFRKASASYQQKVIEAFSEVENALVNVQLQNEEMLSLEKAIGSAEETTRLSNIRYNHGIVTFLEVVDSERSELEIRKTYADLLGWRYVSTIQLIKALGGSWE